MIFESVTQTVDEQMEQKIIALECQIKTLKEELDHLQKREKQWKTLIDRAVVGIYRTDEHGYFLMVNFSLAQIFGFVSPDALLSAVPNISKLYLDPKDRLEVLKQSQATGVVDGKEIRSKRLDGGDIWVSISERKIIHTSGKSLFEGFMTDITKRKLAEASLQKSEARFRMLVEQAGDGFVVHDFNGHNYEINRHAYESLGYTREEMLNMKVTDVAVKLLRDRYWGNLASGEYVTFENIARRKDGTTFPIEVRLSRLDIDGKRLFLSIARDITKRKAAENELKRSLQEIKDLKNRLEEENVYLRQEIDFRYPHDEIIGESVAIKKTLSTAEKVAQADTCVLILGETGTGKELLARALHKMSPRRNRPMITVNCAALPATLVESELFGHEKGAFTGSVSRQIGRFEAANSSTLFLDEIGDLPLELQAKLLRVLQEGSLERLGSSHTIKVDVRVIAATNQNMAALVREKRFRKDLYYRLNVFPISLPSLRERNEDIPLLVWSFVKEFATTMGKPIPVIHKKTMDLLQRQPWPGNIRELKNFIERAMILSTDGVLKIDRLDNSDNTEIPSATLADMERQHIVKILDQMGWRVSGTQGAARVLGLNESTLRSKMKKLGIKRPGWNSEISRK